MKKYLLIFIAVLLSLPAHATTTLFSNSTSVGIGTTSPASELQVYGGEAQIGSSGATCASGIAGALRYATGSVYVCDGTNWDVVGGSSGGTLPALTSGDIWVGNASNVATAAALSGDCTLSNTGAITCTKTNGTAFGTLATQYGINLSTQATGTLQAGQFPALTGDVTSTAGSLATTVAGIQGTTVSGTTGTANVVFSASPTLTGTVTGASSNWSGSVGIGTSSPTAGTALDLGSNTNSMLLPSGTTAQRPSTGVNGMMRYNTSTTSVEAYVNSAWATLGGASSGSSSGYATLGGGIIIQWGTYTGDGTVTFPISFPNRGIFRATSLNAASISVV